MALQAHGIECNEDEVNRVLGAAPMQGAAWENVLACVQHYGMRATLVVPSTIRQLKEWTDQGIPVIIAWNPEGREWSHASLVFDVDDEDRVYVADPNIPDPEETVRIVSKDEFYRKWYEKWPKYLVRRPACAIEPEITSDGRPKFASWWRNRTKLRKSGKENEVFRLPNGTFITEKALQQILSLPQIYDEKIPFGWLVKTGLTQLDEIYFLRHSGSAVFHPSSGEPIAPDVGVYEVIERPGAASRFWDVLWPLVEGKA